MMLSLVLLVLVTPTVLCAHCLAHIGQDYHNLAPITYTRHDIISMVQKNTRDVDDEYFQRGYNDPKAASGCDCYTGYGIHRVNNGNLPFCLKITNWPINFKYRDPDYQVQLFKTAFETEDAESVLTAIIQAAKATGHDWPLIALNKKPSEWIQQVQSDKGLPRYYMTTAIIKYGGDEGLSQALGFA